jgi:hypothetical protein
LTWIKALAATPPDKRGMHPLTRKLVVLTVVKVAALAAIWLVAFSHAPALDPVAHIAGAASPS